MRKLIIAVAIMVPIFCLSQKIKGLKPGANTIVIHSNADDLELLNASANAIHVDGYDLASVNKESLTIKTVLEPISETFRAFYGLIKIKDHSIYIQTYISDNPKIIGLIHKNDKICKWQNNPSMQRSVFLKAIDMAEMIKNRIGGQVEFIKIK